MAAKRKPVNGMEALLAHPGVWPQDTSGCADSNVLAAFFEQTLAAEEAAHWERHFSSCARCQQQLAVLAQTEPVAAAQAAGARFAWFNWRWMVPAAATAALALLIAVRIPVHERGGFVEVTAPQSALQKSAPAPLEQEESAGKKETKDKTVSSSPQAKPTDAVQEFALKADKAVPAAAPVPPAPAAETEERARENRALPAPARVQEQVARTGGVPADAPLAAQSRMQRDVLQRPQTPQARDERADREADTKKADPAPVGTLKSKQAEAPPYTGKFALQADAASGMRASPVLVPVRDGKLVWRINVDGTVEVSRDATRTWVSAVLPEGAFIFSASAPSDNVCWLAGREGLLLRTTDGERFDKIPAPVGIELAQVLAMDAQSAEVKAADGRVFVTRDAGLTWTRKP